MAGHEVWNFVNKFYNLCNTGKNASLISKSQNGKVVINLQLDLDAIHLPPPQPPYPRQNHPSPSRVRRTQRRARARAEAAAAENATPVSSNKMVAAVEAALSPTTTDTAVQADTVPKETTNMAVQANHHPIAPKDIAAVEVGPDDHHHQHLHASHAEQADVDYEEIDIEEDVDVNYNVKVFNAFSPLKMLNEVDAAASTDHPSSQQQPSSCASPSCGPPPPRSSSSAESCSPRGTPGTRSSKVRNPDFDMSFNLDLKFEDMQLRLEKAVKNLEEKVLEAASKADL